VMAPIVGRRGIFTMQQCNCRATPKDFGAAAQKKFREVCHYAQSRPAMPLCPVDFQLQSAT